ncbi:MAG: UPF0164 family protein [Treponema sp.]|nr:UPF0164 family protein [Treponema sp.]
MMKKIFCIIAFFIILSPLSALDLSSTESSLADIFSSSIDDNEGCTVFRSMNIPSGGRTEALGTAFTAIADDSSFFDYNPAASAVLENTEISVSHNAWIADSALETIALTRRNGSLGYGTQFKCFYVPFSEYNLYGDRVTGNYYSETSATFNIAYNFFSGYTFRGLALGANGKIAWRNVPDYTDNKSDQVISGSGLEQSALGLMADGGILLRFNALKFYSDREPNIKIGLTLNNFGIALTGFGKEIKKDDDTPARITMASSYRIAPRLLLSAEVRKPVAISNFSSSGALSIAAGLEATVTPIFAFQCGFLLQGSNPRFSIGSEFDIKGIKMDIAYILDLTSSANPANHISLSAKMRFGDRGRKATMEKVDEYYLSGLKFYANGYYNEAIDLWNQAIYLASSSPLNIRFEPAIQARNSAYNFIKNKTELEDIYSVVVED